MKVKKQKSRSLKWLLICWGWFVCEFLWLFPLFDTSWDTFQFIWHELICEPMTFWGFYNENPIQTAKKNYPKMIEILRDKQ